VEATKDFASVFEQALNAGKPALIELKLDPEAISPRKTLSEIRGG
jgi:acetolactate synthase-1/2/3 large subunit